MNKLNKYAAKLAAALALGLATQIVAADDFADAFVAAEQHEYERAGAKLVDLANAGHADAQFYLATLYHSGAGGHLNEKEAVKWYHKAAENGNATAQEYLAAAYAEGWFGLKKDKKKARYWEKKAQIH